jgi:hypothetical protein
VNTTIVKFPPALPPKRTSHPFLKAFACAGLAFACLLLFLGAVWTGGDVASQTSRHCWTGCSACAKHPGTPCLISRPVQQSPAPHRAPQEEPI